MASAGAPSSSRARTSGGLAGVNSFRACPAAHPREQPFSVEHERQADEHDDDAGREVRRRRLAAEDQAEEQGDDRVHQCVAHHPLRGLGLDEIGIGAERQGPEHAQVEDGDDRHRRSPRQHGRGGRPDHGAHREAHDAHEQHLDPAVHGVVPAHREPVPEARGQAPGQDPRQPDQHGRAQARGEGLAVVEEHPHAGQAEHHAQHAGQREALAQEQGVDDRHDNRGGRCEQCRHVTVHVPFGDRDEAVPTQDQERAQHDGGENRAGGGERPEKPPRSRETKKQRAPDEPPDGQHPHGRNGENRLADEEVRGAPHEVDGEVACDDERWLSFCGDHGASFYHFSGPRLPGRTLPSARPPPRGPLTGSPAPRILTDMTGSELRRMYIDFFKGKGHAEISGKSLIPENDPTVLFTTAGMHPLVPYILGEPHPAGKRLVDCQKCVRTDDIEEVGTRRT